MIAVIFEVWPRSPEAKTAYLEIAAKLRTQLTTLEGFISVERFQSLSEPDKVLSLSFFRDEAALTAWRNLEEHRSAQEEGRQRLFGDYRLRIASVARDYGLNERNQAPSDSRARHDSTLSADVRT